MNFKATLLLAATALPLARAVVITPATSSAYKSPSSQWSLVGCVQDQYPTDRVMSGAYTSGSDLTPSSCLDFCASKNFHLAGLESGNQCYCSQELYNGATVGMHGANLTSKNNDGCNVSAAGDSSSNGGGYNHLLVFESTVFPEPSVAKPANADYLGCYADNVNKRLLPAYGTGTKVTNDACVAKCQSSGYNLAGTENGSQCWCGDYKSVVLPTNDPVKCNIACKNATSELCGGSGYLNIYYIAGASSTTSASTKKASATKGPSVTMRRIIKESPVPSLLPVVGVPAGAD